jgi:4-amino-4-deoxy-L-arabinose transferase-like glycosyltransferase
MVVTGDYVSPSFGGEPRFNKPVLSYWLVAGAYRVLGESVAVERMVIAAAALVTILATLVIGGAIGGRATGLLAAVILATAPRFVFFSRRILIDVLVTMFMASALACFVAAERYPERRRTMLLLMYFAIGGGVLTKGPVALALPMLAFGVWLVMERRVGDVRRLMLLPGVLIVLAVVLPWYVAVYYQHGWDYIHRFIVGENLERFSSPLTTARSVFFFIPVLLADILLPWAPLIVVPLLTAWRREPDTSDSGPVRRAVWCWVVVIVAAFSLSASKEDLYILPAIPAAAALIADGLVRTAWGEAHRGIGWVLVVISFVCLLLSAVILGWFAGGYYAIAGAATLSFLLALTGGLAITSLWRRQFVAAILTLACGFILFNYVFVARALPDLERLKPVRPLANVINERAGPASSLGFFNMDLPSFVYYTRRPVVKVGDIDSAAKFLQERDDAWLVTSTSESNALRARVPDACVAAERPLFAAKASDILLRRPPPQVVLLTRGRGCTNSSNPR